MDFEIALGLVTRFWWGYRCEARRYLEIAGHYFRGIESYMWKTGSIVDTSLPDHSFLLLRIDWSSWVHYVAWNNCTLTKIYKRRFWRKCTILEEVDRAQNSIRELLLLDACLVQRDAPHPPSERRIRCLKQTWVPLVTSISAAACSSVFKRTNPRLLRCTAVSCPTTHPHNDQGIRLHSFKPSRFKDSWQSHAILGFS